MRKRRRSGVIESWSLATARWRACTMPVRTSSKRSQPLCCPYYILLKSSFNISRSVNKEFLSQSHHLRILQQCHPLTLRNLETLSPIPMGLWRSPLRHQDHEPASFTHQAWRSSQHAEPNSNRQIIGDCSLLICWSDNPAQVC